MIIHLRYKGVLQRDTNCRLWPPQRRETSGVSQHGSVGGAERTPFSSSALGLALKHRKAMSFHEAFINVLQSTHALTEATCV